MFGSLTCSRSLAEWNRYPLHSPFLRILIGMLRFKWMSSSAKYPKTPSRSSFVVELDPQLNR